MANVRKDTWEFAVAALQAGVTVKEFLVWDQVAKMDYISVSEIRENLDMGQNHVYLLLRHLTDLGVIGHRMYKGMKLYKLVNPEARGYIRHIAKVIRVVPKFGPGHMYTLSVLEKDRKALIWQIAKRTGINEWTVRKALTGLFSARILSHRSFHNGYSFLKVREFRLIQGGDHD